LFFEVKMRKFFSILFLMMITGGLLLPDMIMVKVLINKHRPQEEICYEISERTQYDKLKNNGDKYLLSLLKRTCKTNEEQQSKVPVFHIVVFVKIYPSEPILKKQILTTECQKTSFLYTNHYSYLHITDIFHPPSV